MISAPRSWNIHKLATHGRPIWKHREISLSIVRLANYLKAQDLLTILAVYQEPSRRSALFTSKLANWYAFHFALECDSFYLNATLVVTPGETWWPHKQAANSIDLDWEAQGTARYKYIYSTDKSCGEKLQAQDIPAWIWSPSSAKTKVTQKQKMKKFRPHPDHFQARKIREGVRFTRNLVNEKTKKQNKIKHAL